MSFKIYQSFFKPEIFPLPGGNTQIFPSGLVRVEKTFIVPKNLAPNYKEFFKANEPLPSNFLRNKPFLDTTSAQDGLYIYPDAQIITRDDGFVEYRVTAYGRIIRKELNIEKNSLISTYRRMGKFASQLNIPSSDSRFSSINDTYTVRGVCYSSESTSSFLQPPAISNPGIYDLISGESLIAGETKQGTEYIIPEYNQKFQDVIKTIITLKLNSFSTQNFGIFSEYTSTWIADGTVSLYSYTVNRTE